MNGRNVLVDTNLFIYLLRGHETAAALLDGAIIFVSFITQVELLSFQRMTQKEERMIGNILADAQVVQSNTTIVERAIRLRKNFRLETPDAIIAATAQYLAIPLVTAFRKIIKAMGLEVIEYRPSTM